MGFVMAAMGSAVGLGNIWRFPFQAYDNGGGVFFIPYVIALVLVGIPLMMLEFALGHKMRCAFPGALRRIDPRFTWVGWWAVSFVMFGIVVYYCVVIAYCLCYLWFSFSAAWGDDPTNFFYNVFLQRTDQIYNEATGQWTLGFLRAPLVVSLALVWLANWFICVARVQRGIERANRIFIPLLVLCLVVLVGWSWGFDGAAQGRSMYLRGIDSLQTGEVNWSRLWDSHIWVAAFSHIFFTLSLGFGIMCAYASYLPKKGTDIPGTAAITSTGNCLFEFFAGFAVFSTVGFIAAANAGQPPEALGGPGLCFITYPTAINLLISHVGHAGNIFGVIFFGALVMAGLTSSISIVEAFSAAAQDSFRLPRFPVATALCLIAFAMGLLFCTQSGIRLLDIVDHFVNSYGLVSVAALETLIVAWFLSSYTLRTHLDENADFRLHNWLNLTMKMIITILLALLWFGLAKLQVQGLGVGLVRLLVLVGIMMVWLQEHWLDFDYKFVIPLLLAVLIDQALVNEITPDASGNFYGGYSGRAVAVIGAGWMALTLIIAAVLTYFDLRRSPPPEPAE
jgi:NSS family neurotransmitter:Na+ symporter